jgi:hypothetical protein
MFQAENCSVVSNFCSWQFLRRAVASPAGRREALPALPNQNDEEAARDEKGHELRELSLTEETR